jgi:hypothetical protein
LSFRDEALLASPPRLIEREEGVLQEQHGGRDGKNTGRAISLEEMVVLALCV